MMIHTVRNPFLKDPAVAVVHEVIKYGNPIDIVRLPGGKEHWLLLSQIVDERIAIYYMAPAPASKNPTQPGSFIPSGRAELEALDWRSCQNGEPVPRVASAWDPRGLPCDSLEIAAARARDPDNRSGASDLQRAKTTRQVETETPEQRRARNPWLRPRKGAKGIVGKVKALAGR
jgi:hypothetical protein